MARDFLEGWHNFVGSRDQRALLELLDPNVVFESPVVHTPQKGREITARYLLGAVSVLGNSSFKYIGEWRSEDGAVLEFRSEIDGIEINGVDIIRCTPDRRCIAHFKVMVRPLKAINLLHALMGAALARG
jgi:hypothetical protein